MKLWLIKFGKVLNAMQRDGVLYGMRKAFNGIWALLRTMYVPAGDILIITSGIGDSARYRSHHVAEELRLQGLRASVTVQDNPFLTRYTRRFSVFIFHRVMYAGSAKRLFDNVKEQGKTIIFETDDLVHDVKYLKHMDFYNQMQMFEKLQYKNGVGGEMLHDVAVQVATTTTTYLAEKLREENKKVFIVPNKLSQEDVRWAENARQMNQQLVQKETSKLLVTLGYFSGVISHNKDFATLTPVFQALFEKYKNLRVQIYGPLDLSPALTQYKDRFIQQKYVPREEHFKNVANVDINIAPLEIGNPFCESKSELKFFEAGIVHVPTVATATQTFCEAIIDGVDGFVAETTDQWIGKLSKLIESRELRVQIADAAQKTAYKRYITASAHNDAYYAFLREKIIASGSVGDVDI